MMKGMTNRINCGDERAVSAALVCVLSCRFAGNGRASVPASRNGRASVPASRNGRTSVHASRNEGSVYERA